MSASCGPGDASGWYWIVSAFISGYRIPAHVPACSRPNQTPLSTAAILASANPAIIHSTRERTIVEVDVGHLDGVGQRRWIDCKVVVLRRDLHFPRVHIPDRVVAPVVPKRQLEGGRAERLPKNLVPHADAKDRLLSENSLGILDGVGCR